MLASQLQKAKPSVPAGLRVYAVGDIHGRADLLQAVFARIDRDLLARPGAKPIQVFIGDYIDRGPHSREVIELLIARGREHDAQFLKGNHEALAAQFLTDPRVLSEWKYVGGINTLLSYGVKPNARDDSQSQREAAVALQQSMPDSHRQFIQGLKLSFVCGDFFFVHAGVRPGTPLQKQSEHDLLWIREDFLLHEEPFAQVVVHGHTPVREPEIRPNRINIDTGAFATGKLTCLVLEDDRISFL